MDDQNNDVLAQDDAAPVETPEKAVSLRDALVSAKNELSEPAAETPTDKARDASGRFAPKDAAPVEAKAPAEKPPERAVGTAKPAETAPAKPVTAPRNWSPEARAKWDTLPPEVQRDIARRESDFERGFSQKAREYENDRKVATEIKSLFDPYRQTMQASGLTETSSVKWLLDRYNLSVTEPERFIREFAQNSGIDLSKLGTAAEGTPQAPQPDQQLARYIQSLEQKVTALEQQWSSTQQATLTEQIRTFAAGKPYFTQVRFRMGDLIKAKQAFTLDDAYNIAVAEIVDPIRQSLTEEQRAAQEAERRKRDADAAKARQASGSINGAPMAGARPAGAPAKSVRDALQSAAKQLGVGRA